MASATNSKPESYPCPECGEVFRAPTARGRHRASVHGIPGSSKAAIEYRAAKEQKLRAAKRPTGRPKGSKNKVKNLSFLTCPECGKAEFLTPQHLGRHRLYVHKVKGRSASAEQRKMQREGTGIACPLCDLHATAKGIHMHLSLKHGLKTKQERKELLNGSDSLAIEVHPATNGHIERTQDAVPQQQPFDIDPQAVAVAYGRYTELCRSFAVEYDLPPRLLAFRLGELIHAATVRESLGRSLRLPSLR